MQTVIAKPNTDITVKMDYREKITAFATALTGVEGMELGDSALCPLKHSFVDGIYIREIFLPAGFVCVGKIHRHDHPNFLMEGRVSVVTPDGGVEHLSAPVSMISLAGTQRALYVHSDTVWITVHHNPDNLRDLQELEDFIITKDYEDIIQKELI